MPSPIKFTLQDVQKIKNDLAELKVEFEKYESLIQSIDDKFIQDNLLPHMYFRVKINDGLAKFEKYRRPTDFVGGINLLEKTASLYLKKSKNNHFPDKTIFKKLDKSHPELSKPMLSCSFNNQNFDIFGNWKTPVNKFRLFVKKNVYIEPRFKSNKKIQKELNNNPYMTYDLIRNIYVAEQCDGEKTTQKEFDKKLLDFHREEQLENLKGPVKTRFITLMEDTRNFLLETLVQHNTADFGPTIQEAERNLSQNKNMIFKSAEQLGYINNADALIKWHELRDELAHPSTVEQTIKFPDNPQELYNDFLNLINHLTHRKNLQLEPMYPYQTPADIQAKLEKKFGKKFNVLEVKDSQWSIDICRDMIFGYNLVCQTDSLNKTLEDIALPTRPNGKPISGKKKMNFLTEQGIIPAYALPDLEEAIKDRNTVMHGQATPATYQKIAQHYQVSNDCMNKIIKQKNIKERENG